MQADVVFPIVALNLDYLDLFWICTWICSGSVLGFVLDLDLVFVLDFVTHLFDFVFGLVLICGRFFPQGGFPAVIICEFTFTRF